MTAINPIHTADSSLQTPFCICEYSGVVFLLSFTLRPMRNKPSLWLDELLECCQFEAQFNA